MRNVSGNVKKLPTKVAWLLLIILGALYFISMCAIPFITSNLNWSYVQSVWLNWQSLNVGVLALSSSLIALKVVTYREDKQRLRDLVATRAFLPLALSELCGYLNESASFLLEALQNISVDNTAAVHLNTPSIPIGFKAIFSDCISSADTDVAAYLTLIISKLQVHQARLQDVANEVQIVNGRNLRQANIKSYLVCLGELQALVNNLFDFSRGQGPIKSGALVWADYRTAYFNLGRLLDQVPDLKSYTRVPDA